MPEYRVTTDASSLPTERQTFMVDGTVPGWTPQPGDRYWDHHASGGAPIQIDGMPQPARAPLLDELSNCKPAQIVTPAIDADACVAAAYLQLAPQELAAARNPLAAIAWDCDHLGVPEPLSAWADFAAQAVATLKAESQAIATRLNLPADLHQWTQEQKQAYTSTCFQQETNWLLQAARGECPWPGEQGEAREYWQQVQCDRRELADHISLLQGVPLFDLRGIHRYVDPRALLQALRDRHGHAPSPCTLTVYDRPDGWGYTLGSDPMHPLASALDYTQGTFGALNEAETAKLGETPTDAWGGRATVGGSGRNTASALTPQEAVAIVQRVASAGPTA